jgi:hypothetical protein
MIKKFCDICNEELVNNKAGEPISKTVAMGPKNIPIVVEIRSNFSTSGWGLEMCYDCAVIAGCMAAEDLVHRG